MMGMKETVSNIVTSQAEKGGVKHVGDAANLLI